VGRLQVQFLSTHFKLSCLPIHDAFLVREADAAVSAEVRRAEAQRISGADIRVELTVP
jgi:hypothetical protein